DRGGKGPEGLEVGRVDPAEAEGGPGHHGGEERGEDERRGETRVEDDGDAEEEWLVDVAEGRDDAGATDGAELRGAAAEEEQPQGERRARAALPDEPQVEVERCDVGRRGVGGDRLHVGDEHRLPDRAEGGGEGGLLLAIASVELTRVLV